MAKERLPRDRSPLDELLGLGKSDKSGNTDKSNNTDTPGNEDKPSKQDILEKSENIENAEKSSNIGKLENEGIESIESIEDNADNEDFLVVRTFKVRRKWDEMLDRIAYHEHEYKQDVLDQILESALKDKAEEYPEIPPGKKGK